MASDSTTNTVRACRVGMGEGTYEAGTGVSITLSPYGNSGLYVARATGDLKVAPSVIRRVIAEVLDKVRAKAEATGQGLPGAVPAIADALTALRLSVETAKGTKTSSRWWHRHYFRLAAEAHVRLFPGVGISDPYAAAILRAREIAKTAPPAPVVSLWQVRNQRQEAERIAAAAAIAAQRERQRIARELRVEGNGQIAAAF